MGIDLGEALSALGAGGMAYSEIKQQDKKEALAERLEKEREARQEQYKVAAEERANKRALAEVASIEYQEGEGGVLWKISKNKNGEPINKELATRDERENRDYERTKRTTGLDLLAAQTRNAEATAQINTGKAAHADEYQSLQDEVLKARADASRAQAEHNRRAPAVGASAADKDAKKKADQEALAGAESRIQAAGNTPEARRKMALLLARKGRGDLAYKIDPNYNRKNSDDE